MMLGHVWAVWRKNFTNIHQKLFILFYRVYILLEHKFQFLANRSKMAHARLIKMLLMESAHFFT